MSCRAESRKRASAFEREGRVRSRGEVSATTGIGLPEAWVASSRDALSAFLRKSFEECLELLDQSGRLIEKDVMPGAFDLDETTLWQLPRELERGFGREQLALGAADEQRRAAHVREIGSGRGWQSEPEGVELAPVSTVRLLANRVLRDV